MSECPVCFEVYNLTDRIAKSLGQCGHSLCLSCVKKIYQNYQIKCPSCNLMYKIDIKEIPTNFAIKDQLEIELMKPRVNTVSEIEMCDIHQKKCEFYCEEDKAYICNWCIPLIKGKKFVCLDENAVAIKAQLDQRKWSVNGLCEKIVEQKELFKVVYKDFKTDNMSFIEQVETQYYDVTKKFRNKHDIENTNQDVKIKIFQSFFQHHLLFLNQFQNQSRALKDKIKEIEDEILESSAMVIHQKNYDLESIYSKEQELQEFAGKKFLENYTNIQVRKFNEKQKSLIMDIPYEIIKLFLETFGLQVIHNNKQIIESTQKKTKCDNDNQKVEQQYNGFKNEEITQKKRGRKGKNKIDDNNDGYEKIQLQQENKNANKNIKQNQNLSIKNSQNLMYINIQNEKNLENKDETSQVKIQHTQQCQSQNFDLIHQELQNSVIYLGQHDKMITFNVQSKQFKCNTVQFISYNSDNISNIFKSFGACILTDDMKIFYSGGGPSKQCFLIKFIDQQLAQITMLQPMKYSRCWHSVIRVGSAVYILGGYDGSNRLAQCEKIDFQNDKLQFQTICSMIEGRCQFASVAVQNKIYVMGGFSNNGCNTNSIEVYNIDNNKWTLHETKLPRKLAQCSAIYLNKDDSILIIGGNENPYVLWKYVLKFKLQENIIIPFGKLNHQRILNNKVFYNDSSNQIYVLGGNIEYNYEIFDIQNMKSIIHPEFDFNHIVKTDFSNFCAFSTIFN